MMAVRVSEDDVQHLASVLGQPGRLANGSWSCCCPAHDDREASLSLKVGDDGKLLWHCHAGCDQLAVRDALAAAGYLDGSSSHRHRNGTRSKPATGHAPLAKIPKSKVHQGKDVQQLGRIVATYDYVDVTGVLLFQVVRYHPKTFRPRRPHGNGWKYGLGQTKPILYRLPAIGAAETVFVVEGEKDADALAALGLCTTTSPTGASNWQDAFAQAFTDKHVVVLPDNDEAGCRYALNVATSSLTHEARSVRIVKLPDLPDKGDVSDWLAAGHTLEELRALVRATPCFAARDEGDDPAWQSRLILGDKGPLGNEANCETALKFAPELVGRLRYDTFRAVIEARDLPWASCEGWHEWTETDTTRLATWLQRHDVDIRVNRVLPVVGMVAAEQEVHPVRNYLRAQVWDGRKRIDTWLGTYLGVDLSPAGPGGADRYAREVGAKWLISAVARVMEPGCKVDTALVLEGEQDLGKSTAGEILAGVAWFAEHGRDMSSKDAAQNLCGKWILELGELASLSRSSVDDVKAFMSRRIDHYRPSYGRIARDVPRQCVFIGTTNRDDYLQDETGNRRFWPIEVRKVDLEGLRRDRDQLWAEAVARYDQGEPWWLDKEVSRLAAEEQRARVTQDPWHHRVMVYCEQHRLEGVRTDEILKDALFIDYGKHDRIAQRRVTAILKLEGWNRGKVLVGGKRENRYKPG